MSIKTIWSAKKSAQKTGKLRRGIRSPSLYFGLIAIVLFLAIYASCGNSGTANLGNGNVAFFNSSFNQSDTISRNSLFSSKTKAIPLETPDLKILQNNTISAISAPYIVAGKVLGDVFGGVPQDKKQITNYIVQAGDTVQSIANSYNLSANTILWANDLTSSSKIKVGQSLVILPTDGVLRAIKSGDTISGIAQTYKAKTNDIVAYNNLSSQDDIYVGDILIVPGGTIPKTAAPIVNNNSIPLASNYFIFPTEGRITQGLHYYNAIDVANKCGTPIYVAASGVVQRAVYNNSWNLGMGNYATILHPNGAVTYYGHLENVFVKPGDKVTAGDRIGLMGRTGNATGCHLHFQVMGATNPLAKYALGATISYK